MATHAKYHVYFEDETSGETLGLMLTTEGVLGRQAQLTNPYAAKIGSGNRELSDLTDLSVYGQTDWRGGRGQDRFEEEDKYFDSLGVESRIEGQLTLGPLSHPVDDTAATIDNTPSDLVGYAIGNGTVTKAAQQFTTSDPVETVQGIVLMLRKTGDYVGNYTVQVWTDSGSNLPSAQVAGAGSVNVAASTLDFAFQEIEIDITNVALSAATKYWIVVQAPASGTDSEKCLEWAYSDTAYADNAAARYTTSWAAISGYDFWFIIGQATGVSIGKVINYVTIKPVRFDGAWYWADSGNVRVWDSETGLWDLSEGTNGVSGAVTALCVWGDYLWAARGANTMRRMDTDDTWGDAPGSVEAQLLEEHFGYLYRTDPDNLEDLYYTADGTNWHGPVDVGPGDWGVTGIAGFRDQIALANAVGLWLFYVNWAYPVLEWRSQEDTTNGANMLMWAKTNELFIPIRYGLYRWSGMSMVSCGPDTGTGLPAARAGKVSNLCPTVNWLYAAIDAGTTGTSSIMAYSGAGWHEIHRAANAGDRIQALGYETVSSPPRLWFGEGAIWRYIELPDYSDNPYAYTGYEFRPDGYIQLSSFGSELVPVYKDWRAVVLNVDNCDSTHYVEVYYELDRSSVWNLVGTANDDKTVHTLEFPAPGFTSLTVGSSSTTTTIELLTGSTTTSMAVGDCVRINDEVRVVESITDSNTFVLVTPLTTAPSSGDTVYASLPCSTEIRLMLRLVSSNDETESVKVLGVACYCQANVLDRWAITLSARCEDKMTCLDGSTYYDAAYLADALDDWIERKTAFTFHDVRGTERTVKITNASEINVTRDDDGSYKSVFRIGLVEVDVG